jgi:hypothetical protein
MHVCTVLRTCLRMRLYICACVHAFMHVYVFRYAQTVSVSLHAYNVGCIQPMSLRMREGIHACRFAQPGSSELSKHPQQHTGKTYMRTCACTNSTCCTRTGCERACTGLCGHVVSYPPLTATVYAQRRASCMHHHAVVCVFHFVP